MNRLKKHIFIPLAVFIAIIAAPGGVSAQENAPKKCSLDDRMKVELPYFMENLDIKEGSAKGDTFAKTYRAYRSEMENVFRTPKLIEPAKDSNGKPQPLTDEQIDFNNKTRLDHGAKMIEIRKKYYDRFREVLSGREMDKFLGLERKINEKMRCEMERRHSLKEKSPRRHPAKPRRKTRDN